MLVRDAGFGEPRFEEVEVIWRFADFDGYWRYVTDLAGGIAIRRQTMPEADRGAVRAMGVRTLMATAAAAPAGSVRAGSPPARARRAARAQRSSA